MEEVGSSIFLTTFTTTLAFVLGCFSIIPSIRWLCIYASITIAIDFFYQITFFVAVIVLDERRLERGGRDLVFLWKRTRPEGEGFTEDGSMDAISTNQNGQASEDSREESNIERHFADRFMESYSNWLLKKSTKAGVLLLFAAYFLFSLYRTSMMRQEFDIVDFVPKDSYLKSFFQNVDIYSKPTIELGIYFRGDIDQSDEATQLEMKDYVDSLAALEEIDAQPPFCWVTDFIEARELESYTLGALDFNTQLQIVLANPVLQELYGSDIVLHNETGEILSSRCIIYVRNIDLNSVQAQVDMLQKQKTIAEAQPINQGMSYKDANFFTFTDLNFIWAFFSVAVEELIFTTIAGVAAVCAAAFLLMPHWTAVPCVMPLIVMLYFDLLGTLQMLGLRINVVTYVCLVISIGLLVDFIMHVLLRYYESTGLTREEKVRETLRTMGASISIGGMSTFLGVVPMAFSTSKLVGTVFFAFFSMVSIGVLHGIIFLPVMLSIIGPISIPPMHRCVREVAIPKEESTPKKGDKDGDVDLASLLVTFEYRAGAKTHQLQNEIHQKGSSLTDRASDQQLRVEEQHDEEARSSTIEENPTLQVESQFNKEPDSQILKLNRVDELMPTSQVTETLSACANAVQSFYLPRFTNWKSSADPPANNNNVASKNHINIANGNTKFESLKQSTRPKSTSMSWDNSSIATTSVVERQDAAAFIIGDDSSIGTNSFVSCSKMDNFVSLAVGTQKDLPDTAKQHPSTFAHNLAATHPIKYNSIFSSKLQTMEPPGAKDPTCVQDSGQSVEKRPQYDGDMEELTRKFREQEERLARMQEMLEIQREQARIRDKERLLEKTKVQLLEEKLKALELSKLTQKTE